MTLSGGQRQRLSIARALLADPLIVIFDDSLSSVDGQTEKKIQIATDKLLKDRTTVIISQRLNTINNSDLIIVLDQGKIAEMGNPDELAASNGLFRQMLDAQIDGILDLATANPLEGTVDDN